MIIGLEDIKQRIVQANRVWLFLDYDGTLADFAPTPYLIKPNPQIIKLLSKIVQRPGIRLAIISGRRQSHLEALLPIPSATLGGAYGIELRTSNGDRIRRVEHQTIRPILEELKSRLEELISQREGFILEDKDWALALHAKHARGSEVAKVMSAARSIATEVIENKSFCLHEGWRFLEVAPVEAEKGRTIEFLLQRFPWEGAFALYIGDDDKDERAFKVIKAHGGIPIVVAREPRKTEALCRLESPYTVRQWLNSLFV